ncbi:MAG: lamin tail domain-containing protein [Anaeromyxobacter sp.]|nr:lamin tail domain-containing protein [Anaeromyxobacter sp.]
MGWPVSSRAQLAAAFLALSACGPPLPDPHTRVTGWAPTGSGVAPGALATVELSGPVSPAGVTDGRRVGLARGADARAVAAAVESEAGLGAGAPALPCAVSLSADGRRIELRPLMPLALGAVHALVLGPLEDSAGRPVLDPEGRRRTFVATFETVAPPPGPPPRPVVTEVRADAATPEAGGEYVEVQNRGEGPLDLTGWRIAKRTTSGAWSSCELVAAAGGPVAPGAFALLTGAAWDGRYPVPAGLARAACASASLAGGLSDERPPEVRLLDLAGEVRAGLGEGGGAPRCPGGAVERLDPEGPDAAANLTCTAGGTPGACNAATPPGRCP